MKRPIIAPVSVSETMPANAAQIERLLSELDVAQLTGLLERVEQLRYEKLADAKRDLVERFRAEAASLGLSLDEMVKPATSAPKPPRKGFELKPALPAHWREAVIEHMKAHEGRGHARGLHLAVWPDGRSGVGSASVLRKGLRTMIEEGVVLQLRNGTAEHPAIYGLASMIETSEEETAA